MSRILDSIIAFVQRNPMFCLVVLMLALLAPQVLQGIVLFVLYGLLGLFILVGVAIAVFRWRIARMQQRMEERFGEEARRQQGQWYDTGAGRSRRNNRSGEGSVRIHRTSDAPEKRVSDDVGDYVDFEESEEPRNK